MEKLYLLSFLFVFLAIASAQTFSLLGSGNNQYGSLGSGNPNSSFSFISVDIAPSDIIQISSGFYFSAALFANGTIKIWGDNGSGQLGQGITGSGQYIPLFVPGLSNVKEISCGGTHILALLENGSVMAWGDNTYGQIGIGTSGSTQNSPILVFDLSNVTQVSSGAYHSLCLFENGTIAAWGQNSFDQIGEPSGNTQNSPILISSLSNVVQIVGGGNFSLALLKNGTVLGWGGNSNMELTGAFSSLVPSPTIIPGVSDVGTLVAGFQHVLALLQNGTLIGWGRNDNGQVGDGSLASTVSYAATILTGYNIQQMAAGYFHSIIVLTNGTVLGWGRNAEGELGTPNTNPVYSPEIIYSLSNVVQVSAGQSVSFALINNNVGITQIQTTQQQTTQQQTTQQQTTQQQTTQQQTTQQQTTQQQTTQQQTTQQQTTQQQTTQQVTTEQSNPNIYRINCGSSTSLLADGVIFAADNYFNGGSTYTYTAVIIGAPPGEAPIYLSERYATVNGNGIFAYNFPISGTAILDIDLKFAENYPPITGPGQRLFDIYIQETLVIQDFDIFASAGGQHIAYDLNFTSIQATSNLNITFVSVVQQAKINGIVVIPHQFTTQQLTTQQLTTQQLTTQQLTINSLTTQLASNKSNTLPIIIGVVIGVVFLIILLIIIILIVIRRKNSRKHEDTQLVELHEQKAHSDETPYLPFKPYSYHPSQISKSEFLTYSDLVIYKDKEPLGKGAFGIVYRGIYKGDNVAIKEINGDLVDEKGVEDFLKEAKMMKNLPKHPNILKYIGICVNPFCIITEILEKGDLSHYLKSDLGISEQQKLKWMIGICKGMEHLAKSKIIHRDLAARNCLLDGALNVKVSDFGLSRMADVDNQVYSKSEIGPLKWMSEESLIHKTYSEKTDVWSFGITCIEILTRIEPYPELNPVQAASQVPLGLRPKFPDNTDPKLEVIISSCWEKLPDDRPTFEELVIKFEKFSQ